MKKSRQKSRGKSTSSSKAVKQMSNFEKNIALYVKNEIQEMKIATVSAEKSQASLKKKYKGITL